MLRRIVNEQMNVVGLAVELYKLSLEVAANLGEDVTKAMDGISVKYSFPILGHEDQMYVELKNTMPTVSNFACK